MRVVALRRALMWSVLGAVVALFAPGTTRGDLVTYSTSSDTSSVVLSVSGFGTSADTINYTAIPPSTPLSVNTPTDASVGTFSWSQTAYGLAGGPDSSPFHLTVNQSIPSNNSKTYNGNLFAYFVIISGAPTLSFSNTSITIGSVTYQLETKNHFSDSYTLIKADKPFDLNLSQDTSFTLYAHVSSESIQSVVPEPSTAPLIIACSLLGVGAWYRRRHSA